MTSALTRVRRAAPPPRAGQRDDFTCAYQVARPPRDERTSEDWARAVWEQAPKPLRCLMVGGWRWVLGLRLGPRHSPDYVLGWRIIDNDTNRTSCHASSRLLAADNAFERNADSLTWSTYVSYNSALARLIWPPTSVVHRALVRLALHRAARMAR